MVMDDSTTSGECQVENKIMERLENQLGLTNLTCCQPTVMCIAEQILTNGWWKFRILWTLSELKYISRTTSVLNRSNLQLNSESNWMNSKKNGRCWWSLQQLGNRTVCMFVLFELFVWSPNSERNKNIYTAEKNKQFTKTMERVLRKTTMDNGKLRRQALKLAPFSKLKVFRENGRVCWCFSESIARQNQYRASWIKITSQNSSERRSTAAENSEFFGNKIGR